MNKKILLIEDNADVRETTATILELAQYTVVTAQNGKDGVEAALRELPDIVVCDIMMPLLDGYGVLHMLSRNDKTASIPFIFLSAKAERVDFRKGMDMGADDYITKPFEEVELLSAIESRLKRSELITKDLPRDGNMLTEFLTEVSHLDQLSELHNNREVRHFRKRSMIYDEHTHPTGIYFVKEGKVKTSRTNEQGKELITGLYKEGDFFGYMALLEGKPYSDIATAMEDLSVSFIGKDDFFSLLYRHSEVSRRFIHMMTDNLHERETQLVKLAYNSVRKRVAEALIRLSNHYLGEQTPQLSVPVSREDLAKLAGTATETTIRTLSDFREEGLIDINGSHITILAYPTLEKMKN